jgi:hypothetical protein
LKGIVVAVEESVTPVDRVVVVEVVPEGSAC